MSLADSGLAAVYNAAQLGPWMPPTTDAERAIDEAAGIDWRARSAAASSSAATPVTAAPKMMSLRDIIHSITMSHDDKVAALLAYQRAEEARGTTAPPLVALPAAVVPAPSPVAAPVTAAASTRTVETILADRALSVEARCKEVWACSDATRKEFSTLATFTAYQRAFEAGKVKMICGGQGVVKIPNPHARKR